MLVRLTALLLLLSSCQSLRTTQLREGDLIFQNLDCGDLCTAIEQVTTGRDGLGFSHMGLISIDEGEILVLESIGAGVQLTPLDSFVSRTTQPHFVGRLQSDKKSKIKPALDYGRSQLGVEYDDLFLYKNKKYYCSELIYDCFLIGAQDSSIFRLEPMTFRSAAHPEVAQIWDSYYRDLQHEVPEGELGINPAGMSRSEKIKWLKILKK